MATRKRLWTAVFFGTTSLLSLGIVGGLIYMIERGGGSLPVLSQAPDFRATNLDGRTVQFSKLNGKIRLVTWFYTHCPDVCPITAYQMEQIQNMLKQKGEFGTDVTFVSINIDPTHDTLPVIREWAAHFSPDYGGWYFLRANPADTAQILKAWGVYAQATGNADQITHSAVTELVDGNGNVRKRYNTTNLNPSEVVADIQSLLTHSRWGL